jgi:hypothetical protein
MANGYQSREIAPEPRSGRNATGSSIAKGTILVWASAAQETIAPASNATGPYAGVAGETIANGNWGRVIVNGTCQVIFAAAQTIGARVTSNASGQAAAAASGNAVLGIAREAGGTGVLAEVELAGPGGQAMP